MGSGDPLYDMLKMAVDDLRGFCLKKGLKIKLKLKESSAIFQKPK